MDRYQVRLWRACHPHISMAIFVSLFMVEMRIRFADRLTLLSVTNVRALHSCLLPQNNSMEKRLKQMHKRHLQRARSVPESRGVSLRVLTGHGASIDTTTASGKMVFGIFAALAEFERDLIRERTLAGLVAARARGRIGGRKPRMTKRKLKLAISALRDKRTSVEGLCQILDISRTTLYSYVDPHGKLRKPGKKVLKKKSDQTFHR